MTQTPARRPARRVVVPALALVGALSLAACGGSDPTLQDLPSDIASARPTITADEARFVLEARDRGVTITAATLDDDLETGTTTCWALRQGGVDLGQLAVDDAGRPLGNTGDALRTKQLMAAGVHAFCADKDDEVAQLKLP